MKEAVPAGELLVQSWLGGPQKATGVEEGLLFATAAGGDPGELVAAFDRLAAWVDRSLDLYKVGAGGWWVLGEGWWITRYRRSRQLCGCPPVSHCDSLALPWAHGPTPEPRAASRCSPSCRACCSPPLLTPTCCWWRCGRAGGRVAGGCVPAAAAMNGRVTGHSPGVACCRAGCVARKSAC